MASLLLRVAAVAAVLFLVAFQQGLQDCEVRSQFDCRRRRAVGGLFRSGVGEGRLLLLGRYSAVRGVVIPRRARSRGARLVRFSKVGLFRTVSSPLFRGLPRCLAVIPRQV